METQDELRETKVHSISLRRPRAKKRVAVKPPPGLATRFRTGLAAGLAAVSEPPQQGWLAFLGLSAVAVKSTGQAWRTLVTEGTAVNERLGRLITDAARRLGSPFPARRKVAGGPGSKPI